MMSGETLLVVDDDPVNLALFRKILASSYKLIYARNYEEALQAAHKHRPKLALLDIRMPGKDGYELCSALKKDALLSEMPIIFVTTLSDEGNEAKGLELGAVDYIAKPIVPAIVKARIKTHLSLVRSERLKESHRDAISMLGAAGQYNDVDTGVHIWRMAAYAKLLAEKAGWNHEDCEMIGEAAPMHDTGKIGIPDAILVKPGKLNESEWAKMKEHPEIGHQILGQGHAPLFKLAAEIALAHHEKWDGSGYPKGLAGEEIPESARIVALADVFDALTTKRPYKEPWSEAEVKQYILENRGKHFDPRLVDLFIEYYNEFTLLHCDWEHRQESEFLNTMRP